jgi:hypothetical protein
MARVSIGVAARLFAVGTLLVLGTGCDEDAFGALPLIELGTDRSGMFERLDNGDTLAIVESGGQATLPLATRFTELGTAGETVQVELVAEFVGGAELGRMTFSPVLATQDASGAWVVGGLALPVGAADEVVDREVDVTVNVDDGIQILGDGRTLTLTR